MKHPSSGRANLLVSLQKQCAPTAQAQHSFAAARAPCCAVLSRGGPPTTAPRFLRPRHCGRPERKSPGNRLLGAQGEGRSAGLPLGLLGLLVWAGTVLSLAGATCTAAAASASDLFRAALVSEYVPDGGQVTNLVWYVGTNRFRISPLPTWGITVNQGLRRLEFTDPDGTAAILLRFDAMTNATASVDLKTLARARHQGFRVEGEMELVSGCGRGMAFDLFKAEEDEALQPTMAARRTAFVMMEEGLLECTLSTALRSYEGLHRVYGRFLVGVQRDRAP